MIPAGILVEIFKINILSNLIAFCSWQPRLSTDVAADQWASSTRTKLVRC
jgi:hypothetical protein